METARLQETDAAVRGAIELAISQLSKKPAEDYW